MYLDERSQARVLALQALCLFDGLGAPFDADLETFLHDTINHRDLGWSRRPRPRAVSLAKALARGTWEHRDACDRLLRDHVAEWSVNRMPPVDRNILRLGLYELLECPDTPFPVVISQAVELAQRFGGSESPAFINGVLDGVRRALLAGADPCPAALGAPPGADPDAGIDAHSDTQSPLPESQDPTRSADGPV
jgi:transcription antitermination protein NusB